MRRSNREFPRSVFIGLAIVLLGASLLAILPPAGARGGKPGTGTFAGTVVDASGAPVSGARVTLQGADGTSPQATETNSRGRFFFPQLVHGYYDVRAYSDGAWSAWLHNIEVKTGKQTDVKLRIVPGKKAAG